MNINKIIQEEFNNSQYLKWKRDNVTLRGISDTSSEDNGGSAMLGRGLYTTPLSNRAMAKSYGQVHFVVNAKPKHPKIFNTLNEWEIWFGNVLVYSFSKAKGKDYPDKRDFYAVTTIEDELMKLGFDGIVIKGREMVNYKPENIKYYTNERQLINYYETLVSHGY